MAKKGFGLLRSLLIAYAVTGVMLTALAFALYQWNLTQSGINIGILAVYFISNLIGGFAAGKQLKERKFIWGFTAGALYFLLLLLTTFLACRQMQGEAKDVAAAFFLCAGGGMIGGMIA